jgi:hypothetical protein
MRKVAEAVSSDSKVTSFKLAGKLSVFPPYSYTC